MTQRGAITLCQHRGASYPLDVSRPVSDTPSQDDHGLQLRPFEDLEDDVTQLTFGPVDYSRAQRTHWEGCAEVHPGCAAALAEHEVAHALEHAVDQEVKGG